MNNSAIASIPAIVAGHAGRRSSLYSINRAKVKITILWPREMCMVIGYGSCSELPGPSRDELDGEDCDATVILRKKRQPSRGVAYCGVCASAHLRQDCVKIRFSPMHLRPLQLSHSASPSLTSSPACATTPMRLHPRYRCVGVGTQNIIYEHSTMASTRSAAPRCSRRKGTRAERFDEAQHGTVRPAEALLRKVLAAGAPFAAAGEGGSRGRRERARARESERARE